MSRDEQDGALRALLKTHLPTPSVRSPGFRPAVWARIERRRREPVTWLSWLRLHHTGFAMAAVVSALTAAALGGWAGMARRTALSEASLESYVASIDPHRQLASLVSPAGE